VGERLNISLRAAAIAQLFNDALDPADERVCVDDPLGARVTASQAMEQNR
jgi:hypothetical protein